MTCEYCKNSTSTYCNNCVPKINNMNTKTKCANCGLPKKEYKDEQGRLCDCEETKPNWYDEFYKVYVQGRKKEKVPIGYIDYFKARHFVFNTLETEKAKWISEMIEWAKDNTGLVKVAFNGNAEAILTEDLLNKLNNLI